MTPIFKNALSVRVSLGHLTIVFLLVTMSVGILIYAVFPLTFWVFFGEGEIALKTYHIPAVNFVYECRPLLLGVAFCFFKYMQKRSNNMPKAKSYLIVGVALLLLYPFRLALIGFVIDMCLSVTRL
ncbi:hypothetical protein GCM10028824_24310 [Hymenobacter segetis]